MYPNSRALKVQARTAMSASHPKFWVITLIYTLLISVLPHVVYEVLDASLLTLIFTALESTANLSPLSLLDSALIGLFVTLVITLASVIIRFGYSLWALRCWRMEEENGFGSLFEGFASVGRILLCTLLVTLNILGWCMLLITAISALITPLLLSTSDALAYVLIPLYILSVILAYIFVYLRYSLVTYVLIDRPELSVLRVIGLAVLMTRSRIWRIFRLYLSFFWWYTLSALLSFGVSLVTVYFSGQLLTNLSDPLLILTLTNEALPQWLGLVGSMILSLFLTPYVSVTLAGFYDSLIQPPQQPNADTFHNIYD